jgi:NADH dehydrogenase
MKDDTGTDLITGAFSYSGSHIAQQLLEEGRNVRTLTFHPDRKHELRDRVAVRRYCFDDPAELERSLEGVTTLYNTYWVRFDYGRSTFENAIENSRTLFFAAKRAGVKRIVHVSIANPSIDSPLPYYRGKMLVERALAEADVPFTIVRPTLVYGGERDVLANNIAWMLRKLPVFAVPGRGTYDVQPVHVQDLARICVDGAAAEGDQIVDAAGPETMTFREMVHLVRDAVGSRAPIAPLPPMLMSAASRILSRALGDVVLTPEEIRGLMSGLLVTHEAPLGEIAFSEWLDENSATVGRAYANEVERHFVLPAAG